MNKLKILDKGITLISLSITVIILLLITGVLVYNAKDSIEIRNYRNLSNDIQNLRDKVSEFYNEYGNIPAKIKYTNLSENIKNVFNNQELENIDEFYVIDLQVMEGISLNYGKDYEKVKNNEAEVNNYQDLYIINKITHGIFYVQGVRVKDNGITNIYYTDYLEPNNEEVDYRYVDGVKIPEGFYYVGGSKEGLVISDVKDDDLENSKGGNQFVWIPVEGGDFKADDETFATDEEEFVKSVNKNKGFYIGRFEAGIEGATGLDITEVDSEYHVPEEIWTGWQGGTVVSKRDVLPWNYVTVKKAMELAENMYKEDNDTIKTRIYSKNAYNAVLEFLGKENDTDYTNWGNCGTSQFNIDSEKAKYLNYENMELVECSDVKNADEYYLLTSGASEQNKIKNVYDLAGNVQEYTTSIYSDLNTEKVEDIYFNYYGSSWPMSGTQIKSYNTTKTANGDMGFRVVLYIKDLVDIQNERITLDTNGQIPANTQIDGTQCYINFDMKTEEGYTAKVEPSLPFGITKNGEYSFKITVTKPDGTESVVVHTVNVQNYVEEPNYWLRFNGGSHIEFDNIDQNDFYKTYTVATKVKINRTEQESKNYMGLWGNHRGEEGIDIQFSAKSTMLFGADMTSYYDKWVDIVVVYNGTDIKVYINSELRSTLSNRTILPYEGFNIGTSYLPEDRQLIGEMSCLKIWDKALSQEEIWQIDLFKQEVNVAKSNIYFNLNLTSKQDVEAMGGTFVGTGDYQFYNN